MGVWAFILCIRHRWRKTKEQQPRRFSLIRKQSYVICVLSTRSFDWNLEAINIWTHCQLIWSGKVCIWLSVWEFQQLFLWQPFLNKFIHVENWETDHLQHDLYVDISNKFTLARVFVSHACTCTQINVNSFINNLVLFTRINSVLMRVPHIQ